MLPSPAVARYYRKPLRPGSHTSLTLESLARRSRITNLGVLLLASCFAISLLLNLRYWTFHHSLFPDPYSAKLQLATVDRPPTRNNLDHLIVVPCHAIWRGSNSWSRDEDWILESYQQGTGRVHALYEHIARRYITALQHYISSPLTFLLVLNSPKKILIHF